MTSIIRSIASPTSMLYWLNLAVVVTLMCGASLLLVKIFRNRSEVFRHAFVVASLLVLLVSPIAVWVGSYSQLGLLNIKNTHLVETRSVSPLETPTEVRSLWEEFALSLIFSDQDAVDGEIAANDQNETREATSTPALAGTDIPWRQLGFSLLLMMWCCGTLWFVFQMIRGGLKIRKYLRLSTPVTEEFILTASKSAARKVGLATVPSIFKSELVPVPLSTGVCYSAVILPEDFLCGANREELEAVLIHEMAHIVRRDHWMGLIQRLTVAIYWWNPLVYRVSHLGSSLAEEICDDYVTKSMKSGEDFARLLVTMAERVVGRIDMPLAIGILPIRPHDLERRITRLMQKERKMKTQLSLNHVALVSLLGLLMTGTSVLSTVWADSRVDVPADNAGNEAVAANERGVDATSPEEKTSSLDETSLEQTASIEESVEKTGETSSTTEGDTLAGRTVTRSQTTLRLLDKEVSYLQMLSPDGLNLVYSSQDPQMIIVSDLSTGRERKYEQTTVNYPPVWSPDSKRIAFWDQDMKTATQWQDQTVSILTLDSGDVRKTDIRGLPCDWSGDGRSLLVLGPPSRIEYQLQLVDLKTGETQTVIRDFKGGSMPRLSPDGSYIVYRENKDIFVQPIGSDEPVRITSHGEVRANPLWTADGKHILFTGSSEEGNSDLLSVAFQGGKPVGEPEIVVSDMGDHITLYSCSNSGSLLFSERGDHQLGIYSTDIDPVSGSVLGEPDQLTDGKTKSTWPAWSPNGKYIAYCEATESEDLRLCIMNSDGRDKRTLGSFNLFNRGSRAWHPDNEHILYPGHVLYPGRESAPENPEKIMDGIYSVSIRTHERKLIYHDPEFQGGMHISPDGKHLALTSGNEQKPQLYIVDYDGQNRRQLVKSDGAIFKPTFTPDGKEIIYTFSASAEGKTSSIMAVSIAGGEPREIYAREDPNDGFDTRPASWLPDGRFVFDIIRRTQGDRPQYAVNMDGKSAPVKISDSGRLRGAYSVSPDGTKAVFDLWTISTSKLWLMSDFLPNDE